jgi:hypothetical protein
LQRANSILCVIILSAFLTASALSAVIPAGWRAPRFWLAEAVCIHEHEGAWGDDTGNGYYGGMQFLLSTWQSVGGPGYPQDSPPRVQLYFAYRVWLRDGGSWREWGSREACGLE